MKKKTQLRISGKQKLRFLPIALSLVCIVTAILITGIFSTKTETTLANTNRYPQLDFHDPVIIRGTAGQIGAVYKFADAEVGVDVHVEILDFYNGAGVDNVDHYTAGYYNAWQPFVKAPPNCTSWVDWRITFKKAGSDVDTVLSRLAATAVDVDGDGSYLKEMVSANRVQAYSKLAGAQLDITFNRDSCSAISTIANVANIDTTKTLSMFMMVFYNVSTIQYRTGAVSNYWGEHIRQNSIYFKYFDAMPTPLPVELLLFEGSVYEESKVKLNWCTASEKDNDYFSIDRSSNGKDFTNIGRVKGVGNSQMLSKYSFIDDNPGTGYKYYRLTQTDYNGDFEIFKPIVVNISNMDNSKELKIFPNPYKDNFTAIVTMKENMEAKMEITTLTGKVIYSEKTDLKEGLNSIAVHDLPPMPVGSYMFLLKNEKQILFSKKVVKV